MQRLATIGQRLKSFYFCLDLRSLGLFRIGLGLVLIVQWFGRWQWIDLLYTSGGLLPASLRGELTSFPMYPTPLAWIDGSPLAVRLFFLAALVCYVLFCVGYRTRWFTAAALVAFACIAQRNPFVLIGADFVMASMLLWSLFLPLGKRLSVDAVLAAMRRGVSLGRPADPGTPRVPAPRGSSPRVAALAAVAHLGLIYFFTAWWKQGATWWQEGTAIYFVLHMEQSIFAPAEWLRLAPLGLLKFLTRATLVVEYAALPAFLLPWLPVRRLIVVSLIALHVGIALVINAGTFSYVMMASLMLLLTAADWKLFGRLLARFSRSATVYYDDSCGICTKTCELLAVLDRFDRLTFIGSSDAAARRHKIPAGLTEKTVVVFDDATGRMTTKSRAAAMALRGLPLPFHLLRLMALPGLAWLSDKLYDLIARNRHRISQKLGLAVCGLPPMPGATPPPDAAAAAFAEDPAARMFDRRRPAALAGNVLALALALIVLIANYNGNVVGLSGDPVIAASGAAPRRPLALPSPLFLPVDYPLAVQKWNMFAPNAPQFDHWWVVEAVQASGKRIDTMTGRPPAYFEQPTRHERRFPVTLGSYFKLMGDFRPEAARDCNLLRKAYCRHVSGEYNRLAAPDKQLATIRIYQVRVETVLPDADEQRRKLIAYDRLLYGTYDCRTDRYEPGPQTSEMTIFFRGKDPAQKKLVHGRGPLKVVTDRKQGAWTYWNEDGSLLATGSYENGLRVGPWKKWLEGGTLQEGEFRNDRPWGPVKLTFADHHTETGELAADQRHGVWTFRDADGRKFASGPYEHGQRSGVWTFWSPEGGRMQAEFQDDAFHGRAMSWHPNGQRWEIGRFEHGQKQGFWEIWYPNGRKHGEGTFVDGKEHGPWKIWTSDGTQLAEGEFREGKKNGVWKVTTPRGVEQETYRDGVRVR